jgi:hypothetical protein
VVITKVVSRQEGMVETAIVVVTAKKAMIKVDMEVVIIQVFIEVVNTVQGLINPLARG